MEDQIKEVSSHWAQAIRSRNPESIIKLYHPDGLLWGTFAKKIHHRPENIKNYFDELFIKQDLTCAFKDGFVRANGDFALYSGSYEFSWTESGEPKSKAARFSFVYKKEKDEWLIIEHHSSLFPE
jgi:uncharacterized protein (TIGR02246 family)